MAAEADKGASPAVHARLSRHHHLVKVPPPVVPPPPPPPVPTVVPPPPPTPVTPPPPAAAADLSLGEFGGRGWYWNNGTGGGNGTGTGTGTGSGQGPGTGSGGGGGEGSGNGGTLPENKSLTIPQLNAPKKLHGKSVDVTLYVSAEGYVTKYTITPPIDDHDYAKKFDEILRDFRFKPGKDASGKPIAGVMSMQFTF